MSRPLFLQRFGGIFEHSPWVAEDAYALGIESGQDSADGLHARMVAAMRAGSHEQKKALILAHPDLAGRLAMARQLTPESTSEQASAGLDALTPAERAIFTALNDTYKSRFGFPFILAVKGKTKAEIIASFEQRLGHDAEAEFAAALDQIEKIALLRLREVPGL